MTAATILNCEIEEFEESWEVSAVHSLRTAVTTVEEQFKLYKL